MRPYIQRGKSPHEQAYYTLSRIQRCMQTTRGDAVRADYTKSALRRERQRSSKIKRHREEQQSSIIRSRERPPPKQGGTTSDEIVTSQLEILGCRSSTGPHRLRASLLCIPPPSPAIGLLVQFQSERLSIRGSISDCRSGQGPHTL